MSSERLKKMDQAKREARKTANQVKFTLPIAEAREEWSSRWEDLQHYAMKVSADYCRRRGVGGYQDIAEEALSESWRMVCNGEKAERAIVKAIDNLTQTAKNLKAQSKPLPEVPAHSEEYQEGEQAVLAIVLSLPERLRPVAIMLSAGLDNNCEMAELLQCGEATVRRYRAQIRESLAERYQTEPKGDFLHWLGNLQEDTLNPCRMLLAALPLHEWLANDERFSN